MSTRVLVADDSSVMRKIILRTLQACSLDLIVEAADGASAFEEFNKGNFDLVLSDWNMPNMTGIEFLKAVRGTGSKVPFVLITTEAERSRVVEAIQAGVSDYLVKPFDNESLRQKVLKFLGCATA